MDNVKGDNKVIYGSLGSGVGQFKEPNGIWLDSSGRIYITDSDNSRIVRMDDMNGTNWQTLTSNTSRVFGVFVK